MAVDRAARTRLTESLRHYVAKQTTNFEFDDAMFDIRTEDRGVIAIRDAAWMLYDDLSKHRANGKWTIEGKERREIARWILFLRSDLEYEWRDQMPWYLKIPVHLLSIPTLGLIWKPIRSWVARQGAMEVWPFIRHADFNVENTKEPFSCSALPEGPQ